MTRLSFVLTSKNRMQWIAECLTSLLNQSVKEIEVVVVNDGSDDQTEEIVKWFMAKDDRIKYIKNETSIGAGLSRNKGNEIASGEIIAVCDDDDYYPPDRAEKTLKYFEEHPDVDIMTGSYIRVDYDNKQTEIFEAEELDQKALLETGMINYFCHPACAYRRKEILEHPYKKDVSADRTIGKTDDLMMVLDFIERGKKFGITKDVLLLHRVVPDSIMARNVRHGSLE